MEDLIEEGKEILEAEGGGAVIDTALFAAAQRVEHYEISAYDSASAQSRRISARRTRTLSGPALWSCITGIIR